MKKTFENIKPDIVNWFNEKGLIKKENSTKQLCKVFEEVGELSGAILKQNELEEIDAFGDVLITLIGLAEMRNLNLIECLYEAYEVIKNRKGRTENGTFIKD